MSRKRLPTEPSLRDRFVVRARYLKGRREFRIALEEGRRKWDERFPQFAIGKPGLPPDETQAEYGPFQVAFPSRLRLTLDRRNDAPSIRPDEDWRDAANASIEWRWLCERLSAEWWPAKHFPVWASFGCDHPAVPFVSACLAWRLEVVSEEWIQRITALNVSAIPHDPSDRSASEPRFWPAYAEAVDAAVSEVVATGTPLTLDRWAEIKARARETATTADYEALQSTFTRSKRDWTHYVRLFPGMTSSDWRNAEPMVLAVHNVIYGKNPVVAHVKRLRAEGMSIRRIAGELGISERHASRILKSADEA